MKTEHYLEHNNSGKYKLLSNKSKINSITSIPKIEVVTLAGTLQFINLAV